MATDTVFDITMLGTLIDGPDVLPLDDDGEPENDDLGIDSGDMPDGGNDIPDEDEDGTPDEGDIIPEEDEQEIADLEDEV